MTHQESKDESEFYFILCQIQRSHLFFNFNQPELNQEPKRPKAEPIRVKIKA